MSWIYSSYSAFEVKDVGSPQFQAFVTRKRVQATAVKMMEHDEHA